MIRRLVLFVGMAVGMLLSSNIIQAVQVNGYCYLQHQNSHEGTKVLFQEESPSAVTDSTYTDTAGYYTINLAIGLYDVFYSHDGFFGDRILNQLFAIPTTIPDITLVGFPSGIPISGPLSGTLQDTTYLVIGDISVQGGQSLVISPGATLVFWDFYGSPSLDVYGLLIAEGTEQDSIRFIPYVGSSWAGIHFYPLASDSSRLEYSYITGSDFSGIYCDHSSPSISHCTIVRNWNDSGGGICCDHADPVISFCTIEANTANNGGGIYCNTSSATIIQTLIEANTAWSDWGGGGGILFIASPQATLEYCVISGNAAPDGGGIRGMGSPTIRHCTIIENSCWYHGAGIAYVDCVDSCIIMGNSAAQGGGGLWQVDTVSNCIVGENSPEGILSADLVENCTVSNNLGTGISDTENIINCIISDNQTYGIYEGQHISGCTINHNGDGIFHSIGDINYCTIGDNEGDGLNVVGGLIRNCTVVNNGDDGFASSIYQFTLINTIIAHNNGSGLSGSNYSNAEIIYSDFYDNAGGNLTGNAPPWVGRIVTINANGDSCDIYDNIFQDPLLISLPQNDYRLQWGSSCIDAGDPDSAYDPDGTVADMGAFYYDQSIPVRILLTPHNQPIQIPPEGGAFDFTIQATNIDSISHLVSAWCEVMLPNGSIYGPTLGPTSILLSVGQTALRERSQVVPAAAPAGTYHYSAYAVTAGDTSTDSFNFTKLGEVDWGLGGWANTGESFDPVPVEGQLAASMPVEFEFCVSPNPFNPSTTISYHLSTAGHLSLKIFDLAGRLVTTLVSGWREAGAHQITFDGSALSSGIYFVKLEVVLESGTTATAEVQKLVLMK